MSPDSAGQPQQGHSSRRGIAVFAGAGVVALMAILASCSKIESVLIGTPIMLPNPATVGTWVRVTVQLLEKVGCGQAAISVNYNSVTRPTHLVGAGGVYTDSVFASLSDTNVQAVGTCGGAIQTQTGSLSVTP